MAKWFDSHNHSYLEDNFFDVVASAENLGGICLIGLDEDSSKKALDSKILMQQRFPEVKTFASAGLHPHDAKNKDSLTNLIKLVETNKFDAIGETGFDFFYMHSSKEDQSAAFEAQIDLANRFNLPLILHIRDAWSELFDFYEAHDFPAKTILHCFTGNDVAAKWAVKNEVFVSYSGIVTYNNAKEIQNTLSIVPDELLLVETDSPYLAPIPNRGKTNEPKYIESTIACVSGLRGSSYEHVAQVSFDNAVKVFV
jgi:TatD DNase family protein